MGMFGTKRVSKGTIEEVYDMVEKFFSGRGLKLADHEVEANQGYGWWLDEGSAQVYVFVQEADAGPVIRVNSPIVHFPSDNREAFFRRLLELNCELNMCCLCTYGEVVIVSGQRPTRGLDQEELDSLIKTVASVADEFDDKLAQEFNLQTFV
jgi:hypothetical protein